MFKDATLVGSQKGKSGDDIPIGGWGWTTLNGHPTKLFHFGEASPNLQPTNQPTALENPWLSWTKLEIDTSAAWCQHFQHFQPSKPPPLLRPKLLGPFFCWGNIGAPSLPSHDCDHHDQQVGIAQLGIFVWKDLRYCSLPKTNCLEHPTKISTTPKPILSSSQKNAISFFAVNLWGDRTLVSKDEPPYFQRYIKKINQFWCAGRFLHFNGGVHASTFILCEFLVQWTSKMLPSGKLT